MTEPDHDTHRPGFHPFPPARKRIAEHMLHSKAIAPHAFVSIEVDYRAVDEARSRHAAGPPGGAVSLNYLPFVLASVADALDRFPLVNASVVNDGLMVHPTIDLGVAVDLGERGLVVPVIRDASGMSVLDLAAAVARLVDRARSRKLTPDELRGGTFTVTNLGMFGTVLTVPIINQPQVAILATESVKLRPVAVGMPEGHTVQARPMGNLGLSFDHRAFDGAYAARFLASVGENLESSEWVGVHNSTAV